MDEMERGRGTATFVLGDVVGSTRMWADAAEAMPGALDVLDGLVRGASPTSSSSPRRR